MMTELQCKLILTDLVKFKYVIFSVYLNSNHLSWTFGLKDHKRIYNSVQIQELSIQILQSSPG